MFLFYSSSLLYWLKAESSGFYGLSVSFLFKQNNICLQWLFDSDTNLRNQRGFTVLHVAALRREPQTIGALLAQGAHLHDVTPDGRTALQICRRLGKKSDGDADDEYHKDHLSIEILEQAERKAAFSKPTADVLSVPLSCEKELRETLSYLENRGSDWPFQMLVHKFNFDFSAISKLS